MGLDMYLNRKTYVQNWDHMKPEMRHKVTVKQGNKIRKDINPKKITYIIEEVGYWRKANHIHQWFVENVQRGEDDCRDYYVQPERLKELFEICKMIKNECPLVDGVVKNGYSINSDGQKVYHQESGKVMTNTELAEELLPTRSGFFFGSTDYDQWYMQDIEQTIEILAPLVENEYSGDIHYHSSW